MTDSQLAAFQAASLSKPETVSLLVPQQQNHHQQQRQQKYHQPGSWIFHLFLPHSLRLSVWLTPP